MHHRRRVGLTYGIRNENATMTWIFRLKGICSVLTGMMGSSSIMTSVMTSIVVMILRRRT
jgi:hypothetical protein